MTLAATYRCVVVPIDGSAFASEALGTAAVLAHRFGVPLEAVAVSTGEPHVEEDGARALLDASGARMQLIAGDDPAGAILRHLEDRSPYLVCLSTHGHGRAAGRVIGSVARDLLHLSTNPIVAVGPSARPTRRGPDRPAPLSDPRIVACVDGTEASEAVLPTAAAWATALDMTLTILTVAEPAPASSDPTTTPRPGHLTARDAATYIARLAAEWQDRAPSVTGDVHLDPLGPAPGVTAYLAAHPAGLVAVSTHARTGLRRLLSGATAARIIHEATVPVLVVPISD